MSFKRSRQTLSNGERVQAGPSQLAAPLLELTASHDDLVRERERMNKATIFKASEIALHKKKKIEQLHQRISENKASLQQVKASLGRMRHEALSTPPQPLSDALSNLHSSSVQPVHMDIEYLDVDSSSPILLQSGNDQTPLATKAGRTRRVRSVSSDSTASPMTPRFMRAAPIELSPGSSPVKHKKKRIDSSHDDQVAISTSRGPNGLAKLPRMNTLDSPGKGQRLQSSQSQSTAEIARLLGPSLPATSSKRLESSSQKRVQARLKQKRSVPSSSQNSDILVVRQKLPIDIEEQHSSRNIKKGKGKGRTTIIGSSEPEEFVPVKPKPTSVPASSSSNVLDLDDSDEDKCFAKSDGSERHTPPPKTKAKTKAKKSKTRIAPQRDSPISISNEDADRMAAMEFLTQVVPNQSQAQLCPFCDTELPKQPSPFLCKLIDEFIALPEAQSAPTIVNPNHIYLNSATFHSVCARHDKEINLVPKGEREGWPAEGEIDFAALPKRLRSHLKALSKIVSGDVVSRFHEEAAVEFRGRTANQKMTSEFASYEKDLPGYYGPLGLEIILPLLEKTFRSKLTSTVISPMAPDVFIRRVLVPEAGICLISEDMSCSRREAGDILIDSRIYGSAVHSAHPEAFD